MSHQVMKHALKLGMLTAFFSTVGMSSAHASRQLGADAVVCFKIPAQAAQVAKNKEKAIDPLTGVIQDVVSVDLLDLYESKNNPFGNRLIDTQGQTYQQVFENVMAKIKAKSGAHIRMRDVYAKLMEASVSSPGGVPDLDDSDEKIVVPGHCALVQLAVQNLDYNNNIESFSVNSTLFQALNQRDKAAFLIHEVLYLMEAQRTVNTPYFDRSSASTRKRVRALFTEGYENSKGDILSDLAYGRVNNIYRKLGETTTMKIFGQTVTGAPISKYQYDANNYFYTYDTQTFKIRGALVTVEPGPVTLAAGNVVAALISNHDVVLDGYEMAAGQIGFFESGKVSKFTTASEQMVDGFKIPAGVVVLLTESGKIKNMEFDLQEGIVANGIELKRGDRVSVSEGKVRYVKAASSIKLFGAEFSELVYNERGRLRNGVLAKWNRAPVQGLLCEDVYFYDSGKVQQCTAIKATWNGLVFEGLLNLHEGGGVRAGTLSTAASVAIRGSRGESFYYQTYRGYRLTPNREVEFHPNGAIKTALFLNEQKFGKVKCFGMVDSYDRTGVATSSGYKSPVVLSANGEVVSCQRK